MKVWVELLAASRELEESGFFGLVALLALKPGDASAYGLGAVGGAAGHYFGVQRGELGIFQADGDLRRHAVRLLPGVNRLVCSRHEGFGYASEAGEAVVAWADEAGYERLWACVRAWNLASRRVLTKLGFHESGHIEIDPIHGDSLLMVRQRSSLSQ